MSLFITNATGFVGANLANHFLSEDRKLFVLTRAKSDAEAELRLEKALGFASVETKTKKGEAITCKGDITKPYFGFSDKKLSKIKKQGVKELWHSAGSVSFSKKQKESTFLINCEGMRNVIDFASYVGVDEFHYISTAFAEGNAIAISLTNKKLENFNNPYEESKNMSEKLLLDWAKQNPKVKIFIYRPSIIIGDSKSGRAFNFSAYYRYVQVFHYLREMFDSGRRVIPGVVGSDGELCLPISVPGAYKSEVNMITIDYALEIIMAIKKRGQGGIYPIVNMQPTTYGWLMEKTTRFFKIKGIKINDSGSTGLDRDLQKIESMFARGIGDYYPYISQIFRWDMSPTFEILGESFVHNSKIDTAILYRVLRYAVANNFNLKV